MSLPRTVRGAILALLCACLPANAHADGGANGEDLVADQIVVELMPGVSIGTIVERYNVSILDSIERWRIWQVQVAAGDDVDAVLKDMKADPDIERAEPHRLLETPEGVQLTIADLGASSTSEEYEGQPAAGRVRTGPAHQHYTGKGVVVAVLDTGMALDHPETSAWILGRGVDFAAGDGTGAAQGNGVDDDMDGVVDESAHHGTHVAGLVHLAAPDALILPIRVLEADGHGTSFSLAKGILHAIAHGADVINISMGMVLDSRVVERAVEEADDLGIAVVAAAGNRGIASVDFPAYLPEVIAVAAVDENLTRAPFSSYGAEVALSAPGIDLLSTYGSGDFAHWSGTSFATPLVSGAVALIKQKYPGLTPAQIRDVLRNTAQPDQNPPSLQGLMGAGVLDLEAVSMALTGDRSSLTLEETPLGTVARWSPVLDATVYDLARGDLASLVDLETRIDLGSLSCMADDLASTNTSQSPDVALPAGGEGFFYLFRDDAGAGAGGGYGAGSGGAPRQPAFGDCVAP